MLFVRRRLHVTSLTWSRRSSLSPGPHPAGCCRCPVPTRGLGEQLGHPGFRGCCSPAPAVFLPHPGDYPQIGDLSSRGAGKPQPWVLQGEAEPPAPRPQPGAAAEKGSRCGSGGFHHPESRPVSPPAAGSSHPKDLLVSVCLSVCSSIHPWGEGPAAATGRTFPQPLPSLCCRVPPTPVSPREPRTTFAALRFMALLPVCLSVCSRHCILGSPEERCSRDISCYLETPK